MKNRIAIALLCLALVCALSACNLADFEFGGLVGEMFDEVVELPGVDIFDQFVPVTPLPEPPLPETSWHEDVTMGPGEELYGFPQSLNIYGDVVMLETEETLGIQTTGGAEILSEASVAMDQQFTSLYGHSVAHKLYSTKQAIELAQSEAMAGTGAMILCYLPLSAVGEVAVSGAFHSNQSLPGVELHNGCWFDGLNEDLQMNGVQYAFAGFLTPYANVDVDCLVYNEEKLQEIGFAVNDAVYSGEWTMNTFHSLCAVAHTDLNDDAMINEDDFFGAMFDQNSRAEFLFDNSGIDLFEGAVLGEKATEMCDELYEHLGKISALTLESTVAEPLFLKGRAAFYATRLSYYAGMDGTDATVTEAEFITGVAPMPAYTTGVDFVANCNKGAVLCISRSAQGDVEMTINVLSVLAANHMMPAIESWMYKVNPTQQSAQMSYFIMDRAHCDLDRVILAAEGYPCNPMENHPTSYLRANAKTFEKHLNKVYTAAEKNNQN